LWPFSKWTKLALSKYKTKSSAREQKHCKEQESQSEVKNNSPPPLLYIAVAKNGSPQIEVWEVNNLKEQKGQLGLPWKIAQEEWKVPFAPITT
jgi:hypothetical protein